MMRRHTFLSAPALALSVGLVAGLTACTTDPVVADCTRACAVPTDCLGGSFDERACREQCISTVRAYGELGELAIARCADCLEERDCLSLGSGACDAACPVDVISMSPSPFPYPGPSPSGACTESWAEHGRTWSVQCEQGEDYRCTCYEDGIADEIFHSLDFCEVATAARASRANTGCRWTVGEPETCSQAWSTQTQSYGVRCYGDRSNQYDCECADAPGVFFRNDRFCDADRSERTSLANDVCGFGLDPQAPCELSWTLSSSQLSVRCGQGLCRCFFDGAPMQGVWPSDLCIRQDEAEAIVQAQCGWVLTP